MCLVGSSFHSLGQLSSPILFFSLWMLAFGFWSVSSQIPEIAHKSFDALQLGSIHSEDGKPSHGANHASHGGLLRDC